MRKSAKRFTCLFLFVLVIACNLGNKQAPVEQAPVSPGEPVRVTLFDKTLPEIKDLINGNWQLVSGETATYSVEFDDTFIEFNDDEYVWTDEDGTEAGRLNWRQAPTGHGYDAFFTDVFYEENPTFPLAIHGDTLLIQDISEHLYLYRLVRR